MISRRAVAASALGAATVPLAPRRGVAEVPALAAPPGPVVLLTAAAPEGRSDQWVRGFAPFLERHLAGREVLVRALAADGRRGLTVLRHLAERGADGAEIRLGHAVTPDLVSMARAEGATALLSRVRFLAAVTEEPLLLVAPPGTDLSVLGNPGDAARSGVLALPPPGSAAALVAPLLERALGLRALHFPSGEAARQAALAGNVSAALVRMPDAVAAVREGRLAALGVALPRRCSLLPDVPTLAEAGLPLRASARRGFLAPSWLEEEALLPLRAALRAAAGDEEFISQSRAAGVLPDHLGEDGWSDEVRRERDSMR